MKWSKEPANATPQLLGDASLVHPFIYLLKQICKGNVFGAQVWLELLSSRIHELQDCFDCDRRLE